MKKFFRFRSILAMIVLVSLLVFTTVAIAGQASTFNRQGNGISWMVTLYSAATGTTSATTTNYATFDYPMNNLSCDFISGPSYTTANISFKLQANVGSSTTLFDAASNFGVDTFTLASSATLTVISTKTVLAAKPFRTIVATVTSPSTTQVITINCAATQ